MDNNSSSPSLPNGEPAMDTSDWRTQFPPDSRRRIVYKIMETLMQYLPFCGKEGFNEAKRIAIKFEEKIFSSADNLTDYLRKIATKILAMEMKWKDPAASSSSIPTATSIPPVSSITNNDNNNVPSDVNQNSNM